MFYELTDEEYKETKEGLGFISEDVKTLLLAFLEQVDKKARVFGGADVVTSGTVVLYNKVAIFKLGLNTDGLEEVYEVGIKITDVDGKLRYYTAVYEYIDQCIEEDGDWGTPKYIDLTDKSIMIKAYASQMLRDMELLALTPVLQNGGSYVQMPLFKRKEKGGKRLKDVVIEFYNKLSSLDKKTVKMVRSAEFTIEDGTKEYDLTLEENYLTVYYYKGVMNSELSGFDYDESDKQKKANSIVSAYMDLEIEEHQVFDTILDLADKLNNC